MNAQIGQIGYKKNLSKDSRLMMEILLDPVLSDRKANIVATASDELRDTLVYKDAEGQCYAKAYSVEMELVAEELLQEKQIAAAFMATLAQVSDADLHKLADGRGTIALPQFTPSQQLQADLTVTQTAFRGGRTGVSVAQMRPSELQSMVNKQMLDDMKPQLRRMAKEEEKRREELRKQAEFDRRQKQAEEKKAEEHNHEASALVVGLVAAEIAVEKKDAFLSAKGARPNFKVLQAESNADLSLRPEPKGRSLVSDKNLTLGDGDAA